jgi:predicted ATPase
VHLNKITFQNEKYPVDDVYPFNLDLVHANQEITFTKPITLFVGENGTGKSTLLKAICLKCGVHIWQFDKGRRFENNTHAEELYKYLEVEWRDGPVPGSFFAAQIFQDFSDLLDHWASADPGILNYFGGSSLITKSHGQSLMAYFKSLYQVKGLYFLDEPETALSPKSQLELLETLTAYSQSGQAQFIIATHSPIILACPGAQIYSFDSMPVRPIDYEATELYQIYRDFMQDRRKYLDSGEPQT